MGQALIGRHPQHPASGGEMRSQGLAPILQMAPTLRFEQSLIRLDQDVGIDQAASPPPAPVQHQEITEDAELQDPEAASSRQPKVLPDVPVRGREVAIEEPAAALKHQYAVALLRKSHGGDAAAEPGSDDDEVVGDGR